MARHPFSWLSLPLQRRAFVVVMLLTIAMLGMLHFVDQPLRTAAAPYGIVSFELAGDISTARAMVDSWGPQGRIYAGLSLGLDALFLLLWTGLLALGCVLISYRVAARSSGLSRVGVWLAWAALVAAGLDAVENYGLTRVLLGSEHPFWPQLARGCAVPKFGVLFVGVAYVAGAPILARFVLGRNSA